MLQARGRGERAAGARLRLHTESSVAHPSAQSRFDWRRPVGEARILSQLLGRHTRQNLISRLRANDRAFLNTWNA